MYVCASAEQVAVCVSVQMVSRLHVGLLKPVPWGTRHLLEMPLLVRPCSPSWIQSLWPMSVGGRE